MVCWACDASVVRGGGAFDSSDESIVTVEEIGWDSWTSAYALQGRECHCPSRRSLGSIIFTPERTLKHPNGRPIGPMVHSILLLTSDKRMTDSIQRALYKTAQRLHWPDPGHPSCRPIEASSTPNNAQYSWRIKAS